MKKNNFPKLGTFALILAGIFLAAGILSGIFLSASVATLTNNLVTHEFTLSKDLESLEPLLYVDVVSEDVRFIRTTNEKTSVQYVGTQESFRDIKEPTLIVRNEQGRTIIDVEYEHIFPGPINQDGNMEILLGKDARLTDLTVDTVSGSIFIEDESFGQLEIISVSGRTNLKNISTQSSSFDTVSGRVNYEGSFENIRIDTVSGRVDLETTSPFDTIHFDSTSAGLTLRTNVSALCRTYLDSVSGDLDSDIKVRDENCFGSITADTISGGVRIRSLAE